jgi:hypothetical protein
MSHEEEWDHVLQQVSKTVPIPSSDDNAIPWFCRPPCSPPLSPRIQKAMEALDQALYEEVTWRSEIPKAVGVKLRYGISKVLRANGYQTKIPNKKEFNAYVESIDRTMLSLSNSIDEYLDMENFNTRIGYALKYKSFINKVN